MDIDYLKKQGMIEALKNQISNCQHYLSHAAWDDTVRANHFYRLGIAIDHAQRKLFDMRDLLRALHELDDREK